LSRCGCGGRYKMILGVLLKEAAENARSLFPFASFHKCIRQPFDYTAFGEEFFSIVLENEGSGCVPPPSPAG
jgi:hypothetical protein